MQISLDLYQAGEDMMRQNLRRRNPKHSEVEIDKALLEWLQGESEPDKGGHPGRRRLRPIQP